MFNSGSGFEDIEVIARVVQADTQLTVQFQNFHKQILENFNLLAGYLLSEGDKAKLRREARPDFEYNVILPIILRIVGDFKNSLPGVNVFGVTDDDEAYAEMMNKLNYHFLFNVNQFEYVFAKAFLDAVVGRIGWVVQDYSYENDPRGNILIQHWSNLRLKFDTAVTDLRTQKGMNFICDNSWYSPEELQNLYANKKPDLWEEINDKSIGVLGEDSRKKKLLLSWAERIFGKLEDYIRDFKGYDSDSLKFSGMSQWVDVRNGLFRTVEWYEKRNYRTMSMTDLVSGQKYDVTDLVQKENAGSSPEWYDRAKIDALKGQFAFPPMIDEDFTTKIMQTVVCPGLNLKLYDAPAPIQKRFKYTPIFCFDFHPDVLETKSVVDAIRDPAKSINLRKNTMLTYLMRISHNEVWAESTAISDWDSWNSNEIGRVKIVNPGNLEKVKRVETANFPSGLDRYQQEDMEMLKFIPGSSDNSMGRQESTGESGVLYNQRVQQSEIMQEWINENAQGAMKAITRNNIDLAQKYLTTQRVIRITSEFDDPIRMMINVRVAGQVINDITKGEFDCEISPVPFGKNQKAKEWNEILQLVQILMSMNPMYVDPIEVVKASPIRNKRAFLKRIQMMEPQIQQQMLIQELMSMQQAESAQMQNESTGMNNDKQFIQNRNMLSKMQLPFQQVPGKQKNGMIR